MKNALMKTKCFAVLALFSVVSMATAYAQTGYPTKSVSIQAGLSLSTVTTPDEFEDLGDLVDIGYVSGVNVRASVYLPIRGRLGTQLGLGWMQKGFSLEIELSDLFGDFAGYYSDYEFPDISSTTDFRINYLSVPALLQFNPISKVRLLAGPVLSFALGCNLESILEADGEQERESIDCGDDIELETVDVSIRAGAGVDIPVSSAFSVSLDAVYDLGMRNYDKEGDDSKNRGFAITAGVSFPLGK